jgi:hypothetical protein
MKLISNIMKKILNIPWIDIIILLFVGCLLYFILGIPFELCVQEKINITILFITFIAIVWYTVETKKMQQTMKDNLHLSLMPMLSISYDTALHKIENVGYGPAISINIEPIILNNSVKLYIYVEKANIYAKGMSTISIKIKGPFPDEKDIKTFGSWSEFIRNLGPFNIEITKYYSNIIFKDLVSNRYMQEIVLDLKTGEIIASSPKQI